MAFLANVKLGRYQVQKIYLDSRIIWEILPSRALNHSEQCVEVISHIPMASILGTSKNTQSQLKTKIDLQNLKVKQGPSYVKSNNNTKHLGISFKIAQGGNHIEIDNYTSSMSALFMGIFGCGHISEATDAYSANKLVKVSTITSHNFNFFNQTGGNMIVPVSYITGNEVEKTDVSSSAKVASNDYIATKKISKTHTVLTNKIPKAPQSQFFRAISYTKALGSFDLGIQNKIIGKSLNESKTTSGSMFTHVLPMHSIDILFNHAETLANSISLYLTYGTAKNKTPSQGIVDYHYRKPFSGGSYSTTNTIEKIYIGLMKPMTTMRISNKTYTQGVLNIKTKKLYSGIDFNNLAFGVNHSNESIKGYTTNNIVSSTGKVETNLWYPHLGYPYFKSETIITRENNGVPLMPNESDIMRNRRSIYIRQAFSTIGTNNKILEVS